MERKSEAMRPQGIIQINEGMVQQHLSELVRGTIEETLNDLLDAEADRLSNAERYERTKDRRDTRAGSYQRKFHTKAGEVTLKVPRLRNLPFETAIIELYKCLGLVEAIAQYFPEARWQRCVVHFYRNGVQCRASGQNPRGVSDAAGDPRLRGSR